MTSSNVTSLIDKASLALAITFSQGQSFDLAKVQAVYSNVQEKIKTQFTGEGEKKGIEDFSRRLLHCTEKQSTGKAVFEKTPFNLNLNGIINFMGAFQRVPGTPDIYNATKKALEKVKYGKKINLPDLHISCIMDPSVENIANFITKLFDFAAKPDFKGFKKSPMPEILEKFQKESGIHLTPQNFITFIKKGCKDIQKLATQSMASCVFAFVELTNNFVLAHLDHDLKVTPLIDFLEEKLDQGERVKSFKVGRGIEEYTLSMKALEQIMETLNKVADKKENKIHTPPNPTFDSVEFDLSDSGVYTPNYYDKNKTPYAVNEALADAGLNHTFINPQQLATKEIKN